MNTKILLILVILTFGAIGVLSLKVNSTSVLGINTKSGASISLMTKPNPLKPGPATFIITVKDKGGKLVDDASVVYDVNMTTMDMGAQTGKADSIGNGQYQIEGSMTMLGPWKVDVTVNTPDGNTENESFTVTVVR